MRTLLYFFIVAIRAVFESYNLFQLKTLRESNLQLIPAELREYLKMLLSTTAGMIVS